MEFYGNPQEKLKILAFTGTKGKTTAAYFAYHILSQGLPNSSVVNYEHNSRWRDLSLNLHSQRLKVSISLT